MGGYNPRSPSIEGSEFQPVSSRRVNLNSPLRGLAMRIRPGAVTITRLHPLLRLVEGNPGLGLEVLSSLTPAIIESTYFPGTDTGDVTTGWQDQGGSTVNFGDVDAEYFDGTNYASNAAALSAAGSLDLQFRGNNAGALGTDRVLYVRAGGVYRLRELTGNAREVDVAGRLVINGVAYVAPAERTAQRSTFARFPQLATWYMNPETGVPWAVGEADDLLDAADADTFGIRVKGPLAALGFRVGGQFLKIGHCAENRIGSFYTGGALRAGWVEQVLANTAAASANTFYWLHLVALQGSTDDWFQVAVPRDPALLVDTDPAGTGEARMLVETSLSGPGGVPIATVERSGQMLPILIETAGGIQPASQAYADLVDGELLLNRDTATAHVGQQVTTPNPTATFAGVMLPIGWEDPRRRPDRPLKIEVRTGAGADTGGGTLKATATLKPEDSQAAVTQKLVAFAASFVAAVSTKHHVLISSRATPGRGWKTSTADSRSDLVTAGGGTTVAEVEGATQGGQTDSYEIGGVAFDRYDLPVALFAAPSGPSGLTATVIEGVAGEHAPQVLLEWTPTALAANFGSYRVYRRPTRTPAVPWVRVAKLAPRTGDDPEDFEAQHAAWIDEEPTWASADWCEPGPCDAGWDYAVTLYNTATGLESPPASSKVLGVVVPAGPEVWLTSSAARWLSTPLADAHRLDADVDDAMRVFTVAGRDGAVTRTRGEGEARRWRLSWRHRGFVSADVLRVHRAAARSGRRMALLTTRGDRALGALTSPSDSHNADPLFDVDAELVENNGAGDSAVAGYNLPAGLVLDGAAQYLATPDAADLDPGTSPFSVVVAAVFPAVASKGVLTKGNIGTGDGYGIAMNAAGTGLAVFIKGAAAAAALQDTSTDWVDGRLHVAVATSSGTVQKLYRDGELVSSTAQTHGSVSNAVALVLGANNGGASGFLALDPLHAAAVFMRELTAAEALAAWHYLAGHPGWRMPAGATVFYDLRDDRCWDGITTTITDLSGNDHDGTAAGSPLTRGVPWPLTDIEAT